MTRARQQRLLVRPPRDDFAVDVGCVEREVDTSFSCTTSGPPGMRSDVSGRDVDETLQRSASLANSSTLSAPVILIYAASAIGRSNRIDAAQ